MPLAAPDFLVPLLAKPVAIFGGGVSGGGVQALLAARGAEGRVYDAKGIEFVYALCAYLPALGLLTMFLPNLHRHDKAVAA